MHTKSEEYITREKMERPAEGSEEGGRYADASHDNHDNSLIVIGDICEDPKLFWRYIASQKAYTQGIPSLVTKNEGTAYIH